MKKLLKIVQKNLTNGQSLAIGLIKQLANRSTNIT